MKCAATYLQAVLRKWILDVLCQLGLCQLGLCQLGLCQLGLCVCVAVRVCPEISRLRCH